MLHDFGSAGDPKPLAILPMTSRSHEGKRAAKEWASAHPKAKGYIVVPYPDGGGAFFRVNNGAAEWTSAIDCEPKYFAQDEKRRRAEAERWRRTMKHPQCPHCRCVRKTPRPPA